MCLRKVLKLNTIYKSFYTTVSDVQRVHQGVEKKIKVLEDAFGRYHTYLRISLTERCNFRCTYCMPEEGIELTEKKHLLSTDEILYLARMFVREGVTKIRLTGGEPTVRKDLKYIIEQLKELPSLKTIAMTTNGLTLTRQLAGLQKAGLNAVNISLDTFREERFEQVTRRKGWSRVMAGLDYALQLGYSPVKVNCVLVKGFNDDEILDFVEFTKHKNVHVRFIEYMPFEGNKWNTNKLIPSSELVKKIQQHYSDFSPLPAELNETTKSYKVQNFTGQVGFISSITDNFCASCNRVRLLADGSLKVCLLGNVEVSLRDALRSGCSDDDVLTLINVALRRKKRQHAVAPEAIPAHFRTPYTQSAILSSLPNRTINHTTSLRHESTSSTSDNTLTHTIADGTATMVDVSAKVKSTRFASAYSEVHVGPRLTYLIRENQMKKGDVLAVAKLAGIMGAKRTAELIPLCHNINVTYANVTLTLDEAEECVKIVSEIRCVGETGVEMEALTAVSVAALTVYDMCKAVSHGITIRSVRLLEKTGGKSDYRDGGEF